MLTLYGIAPRRGKDPLAFEIIHHMKKSCPKISDYLQPKSDSVGNSKWIAKGNYVETTAVCFWI